MVKVKFYSLGQDFKTVKTENFQDIQHAKQAIEQYAAMSNYSRVRFVDDEDYEIRATATTPNGRAGRNIACIELGWEE